MYGTLMPREGYESLTVDADVAERFNEHRGERGTSEFLDRLLDIRDGDPEAGENTENERLDDVEREVARLREQVERAPERTADLLEQRFR